jgi:flagellar M-ring protein FliF
MVGKFWDGAQRIWLSLKELGPRRLAALGLTGFAVFLLVAVSGYLLNKPRQEVLYAGLDPQDVTRIGATLGDASIGFDINVSGDAVLVDYGEAARARMLLAQKGLPRSDSAGYELFDKLGSLGLTSFMQQVTKVRALEGELARTIQLIDGIKAARVHLAMRNEGSFRTRDERPTASVIIRADSEAGLRSGNAIRHLVAAAIPGLSPDQVTVMNADGTVLESNDDPLSAAPQKLVDLERRVARDIEDRVSKTISPYLGAGNFRVSVAAKLNADRRQISQTEFDPNSRVERSTRTIKETGEAQNANGTPAVSVETNIPVEETPKGAGDNSRERKERKEELTNFEINSKSVATTSEGYGIDRLSIALVVNREAIVKALGDKANDEAVATQVAEIQKLTASASGLVEARGDSITVAAVGFIDQESDFAPASEEGFLSLVYAQLGSIINASALIAVTLLLLLLGLRPALRMILGPVAQPGVDGAALSFPSALPGGAEALALGSMGEAGSPLDAATLGQIESTRDPLIDDLARDVANSPRDRLTKIVELDPDRAVEVLRQWLNEPTGRAA